jgi:hypothetical protein
MSKTFRTPKPSHKSALKAVPRPPALPDLAAAISTEHAAAVAASVSALEHARLAGELLLEAKSRVAHGEWLPWLQKNCPTVAVRTAQNYMLITSEWPRIEQQKRNTVAYLTVRAALAVLATKAERATTESDVAQLASGGSANVPAAPAPKAQGKQPAKYPGEVKLLFSQGDGA